MTIQFKTLFTLIPLLLLMSAILITGLNDESLWGDEGWSMYFTNGDSPRDTVLALTEDRHPPLYFLLLDAWRGIGGEDEVSLRMLAVWAALVTGAFLYRLGRRLFNAEVGFLALFMFVMLDKQMVFSQEVRHYTFFMLWVTGSYWLFLRWLPYDPPKQGVSFLYAASLIGGLYTHSLMMWVILIQALYGLLRLGWGRRFGRLLILQGLAGIAYLPWLMVFVYQYQRQGIIRHTLPVTWESAKFLTPEMVGRPVAMMLGLVLLGVVGFWLKAPGWKAHPPRRSAVLLLVLGVVIPLVLIALLRQDDSSLLNDRNLAMILPPMVLLMGLGISAFGRFGRAALVVFILVNGLLTTDADFISPPNRPIARYLAAHQVDQQPIITDVSGEDAALGYHLRQEVGGDVRQIMIWELSEAKRRDPDFEPFGYFRFELLRDIAGFWYVYWSSNDEFLSAMGNWGFVRTGEAKFYHLGSPIYLYRYDLPAIQENTIATYGDALRLHQVVVPETITAGESLTVSLWWSAVQPIGSDVNISVFLLDNAGGLKAQHDGFPQDGSRPTSALGVGELIYDAHAISIPADLPSGEYRLVVKVYSPLDGSIWTTEAGEEYAIVGSVRVQ